MSDGHSAESDRGPDWCAQVAQTIVPCPSTCRETAWHHHHNQRGTLWTNPGATCPSARSAEFDARLSPLDIDALEDAACGPWCNAQRSAHANVLGQMQPVIQRIVNEHRRQAIADFAQHLVDIAHGNVASDATRPDGVFRNYVTEDDIRGLLTTVTPPAERCTECGPGYRLGDEGCRHTPPEASDA